MGSKEDGEAAAIKAAKKLLKKNSSSSMKLKQLVKEVVSKADGDGNDAKSVKKWIKKSDKFGVSDCGKYVSLAGSRAKKDDDSQKEDKKKRKRDEESEDSDGKKSATEKKNKKGKDEETDASDARPNTLIIDAPYIADLDGPGAIHSALDFDKTRSDSVTSGTGVESKADDDDEDPGKGLTTLCLFYQYVEPLWDVPTYHTAKEFAEAAGQKHGITGRMRVAREGLNCTLTGSYQGIRAWCREMRTFGDRDEFKKTEFKITDHLPRGQLFPKLNAFEVTEIVNYGFFFFFFFFLKK
mmetsp:Transcript_1941/g.5631  ORF Transcript_1941/g.5631 Transcript_1941/m.5631 type:complete len:296 (-) Transcript_1941:18-905(-)